MDIKAQWQNMDSESRNLFTFAALMPSRFLYSEIDEITEKKNLEHHALIGNFLSSGLLNLDNNKISHNFDTDDISGFLLDYVPKKTITGIVRKLINYYEKNMPEGAEKELYLAWLHLHTDISEEHLKYIVEAAKILSASGDKKKAYRFFDRALHFFIDNVPNRNTIDYYLESVIGSLQASRMMRPLKQVIPELTGAWRQAKNFNRWEYLSKINLRLARAIAASGQTQKAIDYINKTLNIIENQGIPSARILSALCMAQILFWKGRVTEALQSYEKTISGLEEFGEDTATLMGDSYMGRIYVINGRIARGMGMIEAVYKKAVLLDLREAAVFSSILYTHSCIEIGNIDDAEKWIKRVFEFPDKIDNLMQLMADTCNACIYYEKGDFDSAFECHRRIANHPKDTGYPHIKSSWFFEYLYGLESRGFYYEKLNFNDAIAESIKGDNLYYKGIAYRQRAIRQKDKKLDMLSELEKSEKWLELSGAEIELAKTRIMLGNEYLKRGDAARKKEYMEKAWNLFAKVDHSYLPKELMAIMPRERKIEIMIDKIIRINESLEMIPDVPAFLDRVLDVAIDFSMATQCIFLVSTSENDIKLTASRNLDTAFFESDKFNSVIRLLISELKEKTEIFIPDTEKSGTVSSGYLKGAGINSVILMSVKMPENKIGYICLFNRLGGQPFPENQLRYLRLLCNQISVGVSNIRMFEEMRQLKTRFRDEALFYKQEIGISNPIEMIVGESKAIKTLKNLIAQVAATDSTVLITGETGVGKELVAKAIHNLSERKNGSFISVNLAALPSELIISELFGHEKGAFTGANERKKGRFEISHEGTIFLDEIGDLPLDLQVKLLRVLQRGSFERLGSATTIHSDFRVISATNKDLYEETLKGKFRQDLYYRLVVFPVHVPPLRERKEDIPMLVWHFIDKFAKKMSKPIKFIPKKEMEKLLTYDWPGNVRELEHFVERSVILSDGRHISFSGLHISRTGTLTPDSYQLNASLAEVEKDHIERVLKSTYWKVSGPKGAAEILGLKPTTLLFRMKKLGIKRPG
ncbi:MAG: sigma 54-interacting transcriptional regulator [Deltaproteobacteria bacterium]|nr:sigma 54-interacting transcriptional regulator [Deltaproteobacteria bacterium]